LLFLKWSTVPWTKAPFTMATIVAEAIVAEFGDFVVASVDMA